MLYNKNNDDNNKTSTIDFRLIQIISEQGMAWKNKNHFDMITESDCQQTENCNTILNEVFLNVIQEIELMFRKRVEAWYIFHAEEVHTKTNTIVPPTISVERQDL
ncbi:uncharacterized protein LOC112681075 [Sipha flava]|uniref:Uncharacterized protein LOC112681075 n=2 Tax=Sipha flava TaxID=143950 RepID=A0A8B8F8F9_9HEMI|nr:uncharacterized protein LOC112681075 [Sipha flava]